MVTFNVKFSQYIDRALQLLEKNQAIQDLDLLALQEMDGAGVEKIARRLGLNYVYYPAVVRPAGGRFKPPQAALVESHYGMISMFPDGDGKISFPEAERIEMLRFIKREIPEYFDLRDRLR
jgi:hypothetical protein